MKTDLYTKTILTVIAVCLLGLVFRDAPTVTTAYAQQQGTDEHPAYVIIRGAERSLPVIINGTETPLQVTNPKENLHSPIPLLVRVLQ